MYAGGFAVPFLLGGLTGFAVAPYLNRPAYGAGYPGYYGAAQPGYYGPPMGHRRYW